MAIIAKFSIPVRKKGEFGSLIDLVQINRLPKIGDSPSNHPKAKCWLINTDKGLIAFYKACTHLDCLFTWHSQENLFICPCHGSRFDKLGTVLNGPAVNNLDQFPIRVVDGKKVIAESDPEKGIRLGISTRIVKSDQVEQTTYILTIFQGNTKTVEKSVSENFMIQVDTGRKMRG